MLPRMIIGGVFLVVGAVWFGQGVGWIGGSFMTGEAIWAVIGLVAIALGGSLLRGALRSHKDGDG
jgi:hypothetical protein